MTKEDNFYTQIKKIYRLVMFTFSLFLATGIILVYYMYNPDFFEFNSRTESVVAVSIDLNEDRIENGIHVRTGLINAEGLMQVVNNCTNCHSAKIITQNRMTTERWNETIKWMQETQNLWELGKNQETIVNYLVTNYPPISIGRRMALTNIEWYELED